MGALKIPATYDANSVLLADDEPEHLEWLVDFLQSIGKSVTIATNVKGALEVSQARWFRVYIIDLNIPLGGWPEPTRAMYVNYPGLAIIEAVRSQGNDGRRVIAYSAHLNDSINSEMRRLYTDYVAKGRPIQLKERLQELWTLADQTQATLKRLAAFNAGRVAAASASRKSGQRPAKKSLNAAPPAKKAVNSAARKPAVKKAPVLASPPKQKRASASPARKVQKAGAVSAKRRVVP